MTVPPVDPPRRSPAAAWLPLGLGVLAAIVYAVLAIGWHPIEVPGGEGDLYVDKAEHILQGELPNDIWHPVHYPGLMAGWALLLGDAFTAGKLVSALSGGLLVLATAALVLSLFGPTSSLLAGLLLLVHGAVFVRAAQAASDLMALALGMAAFAMSARATERGRPLAWLAVGVLGGLALGTRFQMLPLAPALLLVGLAAAPRLRRAVLVGLGLGLGFLPQAIVSWLAFGSPIYSEHWRNIDLKVVHEYDATAAFADAPALSFFDLLMEHGGRVLSALWRDLGGQLAGGLGEFVASRPCLLVDVLLVLAIGLGCVRAWRFPAARGVIVFGGLYLPMLCIALVPEERYLLPMLPLAAMALAALAHGRARLLVRLVWCVPLLTAIALAAMTLPGRILLFVHSHPVEEIDAVRQLRERLTSGEPIASPYSPLMRHVPGKVIWFQTVGFDARGAELLDQIERRAQRLHFEYLVLGPATAPVLHGPLASCRGIADRACTVESWNERVAVVHCRPLPGPVRRTFPEVAADGSCGRLVVELDAAAPDGERVLAAALRVSGPDGARSSLLLQRPGPHRFVMEAKHFTAGTWHVEPRLMLFDGALRRGERVSFTIGADGRLQR